MTAAGMVGPNAVIQVSGALRDTFGQDRARAVFAKAGLCRLFDHPPDRMIDEALAGKLLAELWCSLPTADARCIALEAGRRTADYVIAHRIPLAVRYLLALAPSRLAAPILLRAIQRNAWTFAGSGECKVLLSPRLIIEIKKNPLAVPDCAWHSAVFERLFCRLVARNTRVRHTNCCGHGDAVCRFQIDLPSSGY